MQTDRVTQVCQLWCRQGFGENVSGHVGGGAVIDREQFLLRHVADEVILNINILCLSVELVVLRNRYGRLVIAVEGDGVGKRTCHF